MAEQADARSVRGVDLFRSHGRHGSRVGQAFCACVPAHFAALAERLSRVFRGPHQPPATV